MRNLNNIEWGRKEPSQEKVDQNLVYEFSTLGLPTVANVEVELPLPNQLVLRYVQTEGSCTGAAGSWLSSINNYPDEGTVEYDFRWIYKKGQEIDGDPRTGYDNKGNYHEGGYVWAVMDVLRKIGHRKIINGVVLPPDINEGIESYYWCTNVDQIRTAFSLAQTKPEKKARAVVFGTKWYKKFMEFDWVDGEPVVKDIRWWDFALGGHAYCIRACSDKRQAVLIRNSWGPYWGNYYGEAWMLYKTIEKLQKDRGEFVVAIDKRELD